MKETIDAAEVVNADKFTQNAVDVQQCTDSGSRGTGAETSDDAENADERSARTDADHGTPVPVSAFDADLEIPSKKVSVHLRGEKYLKYKSMMDTLLFYKGTNAGTKDDIILTAAIDHVVAVARIESQKSMDAKGTPFISAGVLLASLKR